MKLSELRKIIQGVILESNDEITTGTSCSFIAYRCEETMKNANYLLSAFKNKKLNKGGPLKQAGLFVTPEWELWSQGMRVVIELHISIKNPYVDDTQIESMGDVLSYKQDGYDAIIDTGDNLNVEQALLFYPDTQVKSMKIIKTFDKPYKYLNTPHYKKRFGE